MERSLGLDAFPGEDHRHRDTVRQLADRAVDHAAFAHDPDLGFGQPELRRIGRDDDVGAHRELEPGADAKPLHHRDQRLGQRDQRAADPGEAAADRHAALPVGPAADVGADAKALLALGGQQRDPDVTVVVDRSPCVGQQRVHLGRDGVEARRSVEPDMRDMPLLAE